MVRRHAKDWNIDPDRIGTVGFSVGGHLSLSAATGFHKRRYAQIDDIDTVSCRPNFAIACYSGYLKKPDQDTITEDLQIPDDTPPVFLTHASDATESDVAHSVVMYQALQRKGVPVEMHIYGSGEHDYGVRQNENLTSSWTQLCLNWLGSVDMLSTSPDTSS
jgi:acetyl esterase/lipase